MSKIYVFVDFEEHCVEYFLHLRFQVKKLAEAWNIAVVIFYINWNITFQAEIFKKRDIPTFDLKKQNKVGSRFLKKTWEKSGGKKQNMKLIKN